MVYYITKGQNPNTLIWISSLSDMIETEFSRGCSQCLEASSSINRKAMKYCIFSIPSKPSRAISSTQSNRACICRFVGHICTALSEFSLVFQAIIFPRMGLSRHKNQRLGAKDMHELDAQVTCRVSYM